MFNSPRFYLIIGVLNVALSVVAIHELRQGIVRVGGVIVVCWGMQSLGYMAVAIIKGALQRAR